MKLSKITFAVYWLDWSIVQKYLWPYPGISGPMGIMNWLKPASIKRWKRKGMQR